MLSGLLLDCIYPWKFTSIRAARATLRAEKRYILAKKPPCAPPPRARPFEVELPDGMDTGSNTLLIGIEFADVVPADVGERLLDELALIEDLWLAFPVEDEDEEF